MSPLFALFAFQTGDPYVRLGAALPTDEWNAVQVYVGDPSVAPPRFVPLGSSPLEAQRLAIGRYAAVLGGLHIASERPYPRDGGPFSIEDYSAVKNVAKLVVFAAHVRFADGDRQGAVTAILDGLTMSRRMESSTLGSLVGVACEAIMFSIVESHLDQLSLPECDRIRTAAETALAEPLTVPKDASDSVRKGFGTPSLWATKEADPILTALAKARTQMRLLRLHMRVEAYRWRNEKLPERLIDAAPAGEVDDPLTQLPFHYEAMGSVYRLFSEGFPGQGPMGLKYRRDPNAADPDGPPLAAPPM